MDYLKTEEIAHEPAPAEALVLCGETEGDIVNIALIEMGLIDDLSQLSDENSASIFLAICYAFIKRDE